MSQQNIQGGKFENFIAKQHILDVAIKDLGGVAHTLVEKDPPIQILDSGGVGTVVTLPAEATSKGLVFFIKNTGAVTEDIDLQDDGTTTIATILDGQATIVFCDGVAWYQVNPTSGA